MRSIITVLAVLLLSACAAVHALPAPAIKPSSLSVAITPAASESAAQPAAATAVEPTTATTNTSDAARAWFSGQGLFTYDVPGGWETARCQDLRIYPCVRFETPRASIEVRLRPATEGTPGELCERAARKSAGDQGTLAAQGDPDAAVAINWKSDRQAGYVSCERLTASRHSHIVRVAVGEWPASQAKTMPEVAMAIAANVTVK
jgi:hypothetical protein